MGILNDIISECGNELDRMTTQGCAELAAALFSSNDAFVQYGAGQQAVEIDRAPEQAVEAPVVEQPAIQEQSRGMEM